MSATVNKILSPRQLEQLNKFGDRTKKFSTNLRVYDLNGKLVFRTETAKAANNCRLLADFARFVIQHEDELEPGFTPLAPSKTSLTNTQKKVYRLTEWKPDAAVNKPYEALAATLKSGHELQAVIVIDISSGNGNGWKRFCSHYGIDYKLVANKVKEQDKQIDYLQTIFVTLIESLEAAAQVEEHIERLSSELAQTYEELVLLYKMSTNMKLTETDCNFLQIACDSLKDLVNLEGIAMLLEKGLDHDKRLIVAAGTGLIEVDERMAAILHSRLTEELNMGKDALLDSAVDGPFRYHWPSQIKSIIAVPLFGNENTALVEGAHDSLDKMTGIMVAINRIGKPDFDTIDVKLFNSVANQCAVFIENGRLFKDLKQLFIGSLRALTNSIDAKDKYTRGHSERVAFISRWIAERYAEDNPVEDEYIQRVYLAGLLHDIGKIGIDERVLRKEGKLTEEEMNQIKAHPSIGANILADIKQMRDIIPGILYHHERIDGKGYPHGLLGNQIPLIGKIVMIADSFDAMTSKRTYREAMSIEQAVDEIEKGLGTQFDEELGRAFITSDIKQMWEMIQGERIEDSYHPDFSEYGTIAVGALIQ
jgi:HD-GYP domain-containing protein (c-di-GMP phosphodiesterase class II)